MSDYLFRPKISGLVELLLPTNKSQELEGPIFWAYATSFSRFKKLQGIWTQAMSKQSMDFPVNALTVFEPHRVSGPSSSLGLPECSVL